jgi:hypothetical protein
MRRSGVLRSILSFSLALLLLTAAPLGQTASAQEAETSTFDVDKPMTSLRGADLSTEQQRVQVATQLLKARADTKISHSTYRNGVQYFKEHHPQFYGNFFGDPFYATYDAHYARLVRARQNAELQINPLNSYRDPTSFFCHPRSYDPAFEGTCSGITFAASDFFFLPSPFSFQEYGMHVVPRPSIALRGPIQDMPDGPVSDETDTPTTPDTTQMPVDDRVPSSPNKPVQKPTSPTTALVPQVPKAAYSSMQETASSLKRTETILRIRQEIERRSERRRLSFRERARVARRIAEENGMDELTRSISRTQGTRAERGDLRTRLPERLNRDALERQIRRRASDRSADPGSAERSRRRSADPSSSEPARHRSRSDRGSSGDASTDRRSREEEKGASGS